MKNYKEYYKQMGNLLYSVAAIDGSIAEKEWKELRRIVKEELVSQEKHHDEFGTDAAFAVEFQFDILEGNAVTSAEAFDEVHQYLKHNVSVLPEADKVRLLQGATQVAASFHSINKAEQGIIGKLKVLLS